MRDANRPRAGQIAGFSTSVWALSGLLLMALIGAFIVHDYGVNTDEWLNSTIGWAFVHAYETGNLFTSPEIHYYNGPFFMMIWVVAAQALHGLIPSWLVADGRHFATYLTFIVGVWLFYRLSLRFVTPRIALLTSALFASQPLLFGHAFINQKDTPLMVFFLGAVVAGWAAVDRCQQPSAASTQDRATAADWSRLGRWQRGFIALGALLALGLLADMWISGGMLRWAESTVRDAYAGHATALVNALFTRVATDAYKTPLDLYLGKLDRAAYWLRLVGSLVVLAALWRGVVSIFPRSLGARFERWRHHWGLLLAAGLVLGATTSIRLVGPLAGLLVAVILLWRLRLRAVVPLIVYAGIALTALYITWPALWGRPVDSFMAHVVGTTGFTSFNVLFLGRHYASTDLPWFYLPWLLTIQLTLPAVAAIGVGGIVAVRLGIKRPAERLGLIVLLLWVGIPAAAVALRLMPVYNNFRHELFILPPLFVLAAIGLQWAARLRVPTFVGAVLVLALLAPGLVGIVSLHPYEYVYYNALAGGVDGAANRYELDYWCTSGREAMEFVDRTAGPGAKVAILGSETSISPFARPDLDVYHDPQADFQPDAAILCNRYALEAASSYPALQFAYAVQRGRAILALVKSRQPSR